MKREIKEAFVLSRPRGRESGWRTSEAVLEVKGRHGDLGEVASGSPSGYEVPGSRRCSQHSAVDLLANLAWHLG